MKRVAVVSKHVSRGPNDGKEAAQVEAKASASVPPEDANNVSIVDHRTGKSCSFPVDADGHVVLADLNRALAEVLPSPLGDGLIMRVPRRGSQARARNHIGRQRVQFIGAPFAEGQNLKGTELTPTAMRDAGLRGMCERLGWDFADDGDLSLEAGDKTTKGRMIAKYRAWVHSGTAESYSQWAKEVIRAADSVHVARGIGAVGDPYQMVLNSEKIGRGCRLVYERVKESATNGDFALTIGGDHSIAAGTITGLVEVYPQLAVVWVDAHADANTPDTSPSMHYHGMPAAHVMGWFKKPLPGFEWLQSTIAESRLAYIGLRDIDPEEGRMLQESGVHIFTMAHVDRFGIAQVVSMALNRIDPYNNRPLHLTLDIDGIDPVCAPGTGTLARGGLTFRESHYICEEMAASNRLVGMDLVEVNPLVDHLPERMHGDDPDLAPASQTVQLACGLVLSSLGKNILNADVWHLPHVSSGIEPER